MSAAFKNIIRLEKRRSCRIILIPVVGAIAYSDSNNSKIVQAGEALQCSLRTKTSFTISNIFETISIRKYDGRIDDVYKIKNTNNSIFCIYN